MEIISAQLNIIKTFYKIENKNLAEQNYLLNEHLYNGPEKRVVKDFVCFICLNIVSDPVSCGDCFKIVCTKCIENSLRNNLCCPHCRVFPFRKTKVNPMHMDLLNNSEFICPLECGKILKYHQMEAHKNQCPKLKEIFMCTLCNKELKNKDEEEHKNTCENLKFSCLCCNKKINKLDFTKHLHECNNFIYYCNQLDIYFPMEFKKAYDNFFKNYLMSYKEIWKKINQFSKINLFIIFYTFTYFLLILITKFRR